MIYEPNAFIQKTQSKQKKKQKKEIQKKMFLRKK
jgi:hypothetical protein